MYGHMLLGLAGFIKLNYNKEVWTRSCSDAGLDADIFFTYDVYDEDIFFKILDAACGTLGVDSKELLYDFGYYTFSVYWRNSKHDTLLYGLGDDLHELLQSLNALHHNLSSKYTKMVSPSFTCDIVPEGLLVHYHSARPRLGDYVKGILMGLAGHVYRLNVNVEVVESTELPPDTSLNHYCKLLVTLNGISDESTLSRLQGGKRKTVRSKKKLKRVKAYFHVIDEEEPAVDSFDEDDSPMLSRSTEDPDWPITPEVFDSIAPYYLVFDYSLKVVVMSPRFSNVFKRGDPQPQLGDLFNIEIPRVKLTHSNILNETQALFILSVKESAISPQFKAAICPSFRGQMFPVQSTRDSQVLFLASPAANKFEQLEEMGFNVTDIGKGNVLHELLENFNYYNPKMDLSGQLEKTKHQLEVEKAEVEKAQARTDQILHCMLPVQVAHDMKANGSVTPTHFSQISILFTAIANFDVICEECTPHEVVSLLNALFTRFDNLVEKHQVYKVETVSDTYMMAAGLPDTAEKHAHAVTNMAFEMRREVEALRAELHQNIEIKIGINSGQVVTGVIGTRQPRYCLFGDTVNTASRMNSTGQSGKVHISESTYGHIKDDSSYFFVNRGKIFVKGLGLRITYFVEDHDPPLTGDGEQFLTALSVRVPQSNGLSNCHQDTTVSCPVPPVATACPVLVPWSEGDSLAEMKNAKNDCQARNSQVVPVTQELPQNSFTDSKSSLAQKYLSSYDHTHKKCPLM